MVLKVFFSFFFWFESSIRAEQSKSLLCLSSLELPHCGCGGLGDFNSRTLLLLLLLLLLLRGGLDLLYGFFFSSYLPLKLQLQLDPMVFMLV